MIDETNQDLAGLKRWKTVGDGRRFAGGNAGRDGRSRSRRRSGEPQDLGAAAGVKPTANAACVQRQQIEERWYKDAPVQRQYMHRHVWRRQRHASRVFAADAPNCGGLVEARLFDMLSATRAGTSSSPRQRLSWTSWPPWPDVAARYAGADARRAMVWPVMVGRALHRWWPRSALRRHAA